jgi:protein-disulfide isomerase
MKNSNRGVVSRWTLALGIAVIVLGVACSADRAVFADKDGSEAAASEVLAKVGEAEISRAELEEMLAGDLERIEQEYKKSRYELMERGLENMIVEKLLETEAASRDISVEDLFSVEIEDKLETVSDEQVDAFYEAQRARIQQPKEQVAEQIRQYLRQQQAQQAQQELLDGLRAKYEVASFLEPMRVEVAAGVGPTRGPADAPVTIVEFSDFQCPFCSRVIPTLDRVIEEYGDKVQLIFRQFPLRNIHPEAQKAAEASLCADDQGKFWEMHDLMFADQGGLSIDKLKEKAGELELDLVVFGECLDSDKYAEQVEADLQAGSGAGVSGTPALFINGRFLSGAQPYDVIAKVIDDELSRHGD